MFNKQQAKIKEKIEATINKAIAGNADMRSLLALLQTIGMILAMILGALAILAVILLVQSGAAAP